MGHFSLLFLTLSFFAVPLLVHASALSLDHHTHSRRNHSQLAHQYANLLKRRRSQARAGPVARCSSSSPPPKASGASGSVLVVQSNCGNIGATTSVTATTGPNGNEDWLNCGINDGGGWRPPHVTVSDLIVKDLGSAMQTPGSPFLVCQPYIQLFNKSGQENGLPAILLASIALQESTCNPDTVGGGGESGLMQITSDKCNNAPGGNCKDPDYNVKTGAKFFADTLASNGGNVLQTIGMYNGWQPGMTQGGATAAASGSCCTCQNNLDYLQQVLNGWMQNVDAYHNTPRLGKYFNLDQCKR